MCHWICHKYLLCGTNASLEVTQIFILQHKGITGFAMNIYSAARIHCWIFYKYLFCDTHASLEVLQIFICSKNTLPYLQEIFILHCKFIAGCSRNIYSALQIYCWMCKKYLFCTSNLLLDVQEIFILHHKFIARCAGHIYSAAQMHCWIHHKYLFHSTPALLCVPQIFIQ
jgi:hypothetical protein